jgi:hypothetical protein
MPNAVDRFLYGWSLFRTWINYTLPSFGYRARNVRARWGR